MSRIVTVLLVICYLFHTFTAAVLAPRNVVVSGQTFVVAATGKQIMLTGPNVVMKGPPYLPSVSGNVFCVDNTSGDCVATGTCTSCSTFNEFDVAHIKSMGWNAIRLGVVWAGAQPTDEDSLDPDFLLRLHAVLDLTDKTGLHVILDNHGDMVGSAGCGNGVPMWFSKQAASELIGKPLVTGLPYSLVPAMNIKNLAGYDTCGDNAAAWAAHAGDPNYNLLNACCQAMNSPNPGALGFTTINQKTMDYLVKAGPGRDKFVRFWTLLSQAVTSHPSAVAAELMNEPMTIHRHAMYDTWRVTTEAIVSVIPDMSVALCDTGEGALLPTWLSKIDAAIDISHNTTQWIKNSKNSFYAWHWYGSPADPNDAVKSVNAISKAWNLPTMVCAG